MKSSFTILFFNSTSSQAKYGLANSDTQLESYWFRNFLFCEVWSYTDKEVKQEWNQRYNFIRVKQMYTYLMPR